MPIDERKQKIKKHINENMNDDFPNQLELQSNISIMFNSEKPNNLTDYIIVKNHKDKIYYHNNYYLLNEEIVGLINENYKKHLFIAECLVGEGRIIILNHPKSNKNLIEVGTFNNNDSFQIQLIIDIFKFYEKEEQKIINHGYREYYKTFFVFANNNTDISPLFDDNNNINGNGYLMSKRNNPFNIEKDFSDYIFNKILIKTIYLIIYFNSYKNHIKKKVSSHYFLINEKWINTFKEKYFYEKTKQEINKNAKTIIESFMMENNNNNYNEYNAPKLKKIFLLVNHISEINKFYNDNQEKMIKEEFPDLEPNFEAYKNEIEDYKFTIFNHFILIEKKMLEKIFDGFSQNMEYKNFFCQCYYLEDLIFIELNKQITGLVNKLVIEVGYIDNDKNEFILKYLIIFDNKNYFNDFLNYLKEYGCQKYFGMFQFGTLTIKPFQINSKKLGYICNYAKNDNKQNSENIKPIQQDISNYDDFENNYIPIKNKFKDAPKIGLQNVGATCYMNATIQCFGQIEKLVDYFKSKKTIYYTIKKYKKEKENCLTESFKILIENLWPTDKKYSDSKYNLKNSNNKYFIPKEFKEKISKMNNLFEGAKANDSKDLVNFIIMRLHEELNEMKKRDDIDNNNSPCQEDEISMLNYFKESYYRENKSIISDLFYGINGTIYQCSKCHTKKFNYQIVFFYIFPLEEVRKFKIQNLQEMQMNKIQQMQIQMQMGQNMGYMNNMNIMLLCQPYFSDIQNINSVTLKDCFDYNQKIEIMSGTNSMYCNICKNQETAFYQTYIVNSPEIIIIILNRGKGIEFNVKLEFSELLNIKNYLKSSDSPYNYKLIGVVTHLGESGASGHFIAYCKSPIDDKWYNYNDDLCFLVTNFKEQVIDYAMPYILFYQKV